MAGGADAQPDPAGPEPAGALPRWIGRGAALGLGLLRKKQYLRAAEALRRLDLTTALGCNAADRLPRASSPRQAKPAGKPALHGRCRHRFVATLDAMTPMR